MDENIQKLQQIGIKEISKQTRISSSRLKNIFEYNFANFKRVHLVGFLQILEREYKMDLSSVLEAYDRFGENDGMQVHYDDDLQDDFASHQEKSKPTKQTQKQIHQETHDNSHTTQRQESKAQEQIASFDFGVADKDNAPKQKKEIPQIDLRLDIDEPKKDSQVDTKDSEPKDEKPAKTLQKPKESKSPKDKKSIHNEASFDTQKRRYDSIDKRKKEAISKQRFYLTIVCTIIAVLIYLIYQNLSAQKQDNQEANTDFVLPEEADRGYEAQSITQNPQSEQSEASEQENAQDTQSEDSTKENAQESSTDAQALDSAQANATNQAQNLQSLQPTQPAPQIAGKMVLKAETMLWFDIVDLDTNRRKYQGVTSDTYSIDKDDNHRWLLAFGHSNFSLSMNGASVDVPRLDVPLYFIYEPASGFKRIDNVTYKRLSDQAR